MESNHNVFRLGIVIRYHGILILQRNEEIIVNILQRNKEIISNFLRKERKLPIIFARQNKDLM